MSDIWSPAKIGALETANRLAMAPMTRSRAQADGTPGPLAAQYYGQRAGLGLIIAEGTQPSDDGQGYLTTPGIYTDAHVEGWRKVTSAVHAKGSLHLHPVDACRADLPPRQHAASQAGGSAFRREARRSDLHRKRHAGGAEAPCSDY